MNSALNDWNSPATWVLGGLVAFTLLYKYTTSNFEYFSKQNIEGPKPRPLVGNLWGVWKKILPDYDLQLAQTYGKLFGIFDGSRPNLFIMDPELIKKIYIKDFENFVNRRDFAIEDKYFRMFLTVLKDQAWKDVRSSTSPTFTSGKIKRTSKLIQKCSLQFVEKFRQVAKTTGKINAKEEFSNLTMDIIATCAFGMKIQSLGDEDDPFMTKARLLFDNPFNRTPGIIIPFMFPNITGKIAQFFFSLKLFDFFVNIVRDVLRERRASGQNYDDFIDLALESVAEVSKANATTGGRVWNQDEIEEIVVAQAVLFLLAGYDTTATTLNNCMFYLAKNPDLQERLYNDVQEQYDIYGEVTHELVTNVPYAEQCVQEVLRLHPPAFRLERVCNKDTNYGDIFIQKDSIVTVPVYAVHRCADYYPDPDRFDPERWTPENKATRSPYVYAPFGLGPRNCVGMRFALEELRMVLCIMVREFRFFEVKETPEKVQVKPGLNFLTQPTNMIVGIEARS